MHQAIRPLLCACSVAIKPVCVCVAIRSLPAPLPDAFASNEVPWQKWRARFWRNGPQRFRYEWEVGAACQRKWKFHAVSDLYMQRCSFMRGPHVDKRLALIVCESRPPAVLHPWIDEGVIALAHDMP